MSNRFVDDSLDYITVVMPSKSKGLTPDQKRIHWEAYARKTERQEEVFKKVFDALFIEQKNQVVERYEKTGKLPKLDNDLTAKKFQPAIEIVYHDAFEDAVSGKAVKQLDDFARVWILNRSLTLAKAINLTTMEALRRELALGFEVGESIRQIAKRLEGYFTDNAKYRANMISRTEVITASNKGANDRYQKEGVKEVEWLTSPDGCPECIALNGNIYPIDSGERPSLHPNCRCVILPVIE